MIQVSPRLQTEKLPRPCRIIVPGEIATLSDFTSGNRDTLSIRCWPNDAGGDLYLFPNDNFPETDFARIVPAALYTPAHCIGTLASGGMIRHTILTETRRQIELTLRHRPGHPLQ